MITVFLVRHADIDVPPAPGVNDPHLNAAGRERAKALTHALGLAGVASVFTSTLTRTKETAAPLADKLELIPQDDGDNPLALIAKVKSGVMGNVVLIAGHSDTVPKMIAALGVGPPMPVIGSAEFDNLFVVTVPEAGPAVLVRLKYGKPSV